MQPQTSQVFESYLPVYDAVPDKWEEAQSFIAERFKEIANAVNAREIGFFIDEEVLSGKAFIPGLISQGNASPQQFRQILRKVIDVSPLVVGLNPPVLHGIVFDSNFTLIDIWVAGTNSTTFTARNINPNDIIMNSTQVIITSPQAFDRAFCTIEYMQEL